MLCGGSFKSALVTERIANAIPYMLRGGSLKSALVTFSVASALPRVRSYSYAAAFAAVGIAYAVVYVSVCRSVLTAFVTVYIAGIIVYVRGIVFSCFAASASVPMRIFITRVIITPVVAICVTLLKVYVIAIRAYRVVDIILAVCLSLSVYLQSTERMYMLFLLGKLYGGKNCSVCKSDNKSAFFVKLDLFYGCACSSGITLAALGFNVGLFSVDYPVSVFTNFDSRSFTVRAVSSVRAVFSVFALVAFVTLNVSKRSPGFAVIVRNIKLVILYLERRSYTVCTVFSI